MENSKGQCNGSHKSIKSQLIVNLRDIFIICFIFVLTYKLALSEIDIDLRSLDSNVITSFLVAGFAIYLSILFYIKADEASKRFYNDSHNFSTQISVLLNRIESGFGEKLQNIDRRYGDLNARLFESSSTLDFDKKVRDEIKHNTETSIDEILSEDSLSSENKDELKKVIHQYMGEVDKSQNELNILRTITKNRVSNLNDGFLKFLRQKVSKLNIEKSSELSIEYISEIFSELKSKGLINKNDLKFMLKNDLVSENFELTENGFFVLMETVKDNFK